MSVRRITQELSQLKTKPPKNISLGPVNDDNIYEWSAIVTGPKGTPYYNGKYSLSIKIPRDYPFQPPEVKFMTPIYACNVNESGDISADILKHKWSPALTIKSILETFIISIFYKGGAMDHGLISRLDAYHLYTEDINRFCQNALKCNYKHAQAQNLCYLFPQKPKEEYTNIETFVIKHYCKKMDFDVIQTILQYVGNEDYHCGLYRFIHKLFPGYPKTERVVDLYNNFGFNKDNIDEGSMEVFCKTTTGRTVSLYMSPSNTIEKLKGKIAYKENITEDLHYYTIRLIFQGFMLQDGSTLSECNIHVRSEVTMVLRSRAG